MSQGCPDDVYEATSAEEWVDCKRRRNFLGMIIGVVIVIIIMIIIYFVGGFWINVVSILTSAFVITGMLVSHFWWIPASARTEYSIFKRDFDYLKRTGKTDEEAHDILRNERVTKGLFSHAGNPAPSPAMSFLGTMAATATATAMKRDATKK